MTINPQDVKLYESQRLTDDSDGGGRATGNEVVDGQVNNLFPDISRLDRTVGDVALRKAFAGVNTNNQDVYLGAHALVSKKPLDSNVSVVLFKATNEHDTRTEASDFLESYVTKSVDADFFLLGDQLPGQRKIVAFQQEYQQVPEVGQVFYLNCMGDEQYVRFTRVETNIVTYSITISSGVTQVQRRRLDLEISAPLDFKFDGGQPTSIGTSNSNTDIKTTEVSDAAEFYGAAQLQAAITPGDLNCKVDDIYAAIVPSAQSEQALLDQPASRSRPSYTTQGAQAVFTRGQKWRDVGETTNIYFEHSIAPFTVMINASSVQPASRLAADFIDDGKGLIVQQNSNKFEGVVDYESGLVQLVSKQAASSSIAGSFNRAALIAGKTITAKRSVTQATRGFIYNFSAGGMLPKPGSFVVSYMALGRWYEITDNGDGTMGGGGQPGTGTIDYQNGTTSVTLAALPDVDTVILANWLADIPDEALTITTGSGGIDQPGLEIALTSNVNPGSVSISYIAGGTTYTATDSVTQGQISGDGTGSISYSDGVILFKPTIMPDDASVIDINYEDAAESYSQEVTLTDSQQTQNAGVISFTLADVPVKPGSVTVSYILGRPYLQDNRRKTATIPATLRDNGAGGFHDVVGTIDYTTGAVSVKVIDQITLKYKFAGDPTQIDVFEKVLTPLSVKSQNVVTTNTARALSPTLGEVKLHVDSSNANPIINGTLSFDWAGDKYYDRNGLIYKNFSSTTGVGVAVGSIDYIKKEIVLTDYPRGVTPNIVVTGGLTYGRGAQSERFYFRTAGAPIRPQSFQLEARHPDGSLISAISDESGAISAAGVEGTIDYKTGIVGLWFTDNPADDSGASDIPMNIADVEYNAVLVSSLPLDAELIGLNPVRLPADGRVPLFRPGNVVVLSHKDSTNIGTPTDGQTITLSRDHQVDIAVVDSNGVAMDPAQYAINKLAGTITFASPVTIQDAAAGALTTPLFVEDSIEHMTVCNDVQVTGQLGFISPAFHDFPVGSVVSSALTWGDIRARYYGLFDQQTWGNGNWSAAVTGNNAIGTFDELNYPIETYNNGAVTEKWAIVFTSASTFQVVGHTLGVIATGNTGIDCAPVNPNTGNPYFIIRTGGWGAGWVAGNAVRFNTDGCLAPLWVARTVLSGQPEQDNDAFTIQIRGDAD